MPRWVRERIGLCVYTQGQDAFEDFFGEGQDGESHFEGSRKGGGKVRGDEGWVEVMEIYSIMGSPLRSRLQGRVRASRLDSSS